MSETVYTIGHSTHTIEEFIGLLQAHQIEVLADIRSYPGSRRYPQFGQEALRKSLEAAGIEYRWLGQTLGGRRHNKPTDERNAGWRVAAFRSYADYASSSAQFGSGLLALETVAGERRTAYMCSEHTHLRCHRRIVSDWLKVRGWDVEHILSNGKLEPHAFTLPTHLDEGLGVLTYPKYEGGTNEQLS